MTWYSVYESLAESSADELDYWFIRELFMSDDEKSDYEGIVSTLDEKINFL